VPWTPNILDIGCSTGNFLRYLRHMANRPLMLTGGDLMAPAIEECKAEKVWRVSTSR
jgi:2-polyprenyl-3-methyl-5-hydroxy-6-metoxy-1,4-benzoquinol methylase